MYVCEVDDLESNEAENFVSGVRDLCDTTQRRVERKIEVDEHQVKPPGTKGSDVGDWRHSIGSDTFEERLELVGEVRIVQSVMVL